MKLLRSVREEVELETGIGQSSMLLAISPSVTCCNGAASASQPRHDLAPCRLAWRAAQWQTRASARFSHRGGVIAIHLQLGVYATSPLPDLSPMPLSAHHRQSRP